MDLRYPIGRFTWPESVPPRMRSQLIGEIAAAPVLLSEAVKDLHGPQLETPYRPDGWTVRQVVHHVADSHMNSFIRFRLALTEEEPVVKPYDQEKWAGLHDSLTAPIETSLQLLESLHSRWVAMLGSLSEADFGRTFRHPELGVLRLDANLAQYAWHGRHHAAHITGLRQRMGWK